MLCCLDDRKGIRPAKNLCHMYSNVLFEKSGVRNELIQVNLEHGRLSGCDGGGHSHRPVHGPSAAGSLLYVCTIVA